MYARYSHDGNSSNGPRGSNFFPSSWLVNTNWSDQSVMGLTSTFTPSLVNDFRFSYQYWHNRNLFPTATDCGSRLRRHRRPRAADQCKRIERHHRSHVERYPGPRSPQVSVQRRTELAKRRAPPPLRRRDRARAGHRILGLLRSDVRRGCSAGDWSADCPRLSQALFPNSAESGQHHSGLHEPAVPRRRHRRRRPRAAAAV